MKSIGHSSRNVIRGADGEAVVAAEQRAPAAHRAQPTLRQAVAVAAVAEDLEAEVSDFICRSTGAAFTISEAA